MRPPLRGSWWGREFGKHASARTLTGGDARPPPKFFWRWRTEVSEQRAELRSAGQPGAAVPTWFGVAGEEFGGTPALEPGRAGTPVLHRVFLMADRSAEQRAELRSAGQPTAAVPTWFFFQIGMRAGSASVRPTREIPSRPPMAG